MNEQLIEQNLPHSGENVKCPIDKHLSMGQILTAPYRTLAKMPLQTGDLQKRLADMLDQALRYAARGIPVFPCHVPIFDATGAVVGCTCEDYRHEKGKSKKPLGLDERCGTPGKCPLIDFTKNATTDENVIREWFKKPWMKYHPVAVAGKYFFVPNLAARCDGLVVIDHDNYKPEYSGHELFHMAGTDTPTLHARGAHQWFAMPAGLRLGAGTGNLPDGCDVKAGASLYAVLSPSQHWTGVKYEWEEGLSLFDVPLAPLPQEILDLLPTGKALVAPATFGKAVDCPDIKKLRLKPEILHLLNSVAPVGQRSDADQSAISSLIRHGLNDDQILAVFQRQPIGTDGKYAEAGDGYLATSIANARAFLAKQDAQQEGKEGDTPPLTDAAADLAQETQQKEEETVTPPVDLATLTAQIEANKGNQDKLREFALDSVPQIAAFKAVDREKAFIALEKAGAGARWVRDFRGVIRRYEKEQKASDEDDDEFKTIDYIMALSYLGYNLRQNLLDDCIQNGDVILDEFSDAIILNAMNDDGFESEPRIRRAALEMAHRDKFHPLQEYLEGLTWDGQDHISALAGKITDSHEAITYTDGSKRTVTHAFLRRFLTGMIAKVYEQTQNVVLVFAGGQGLGKSSLVRWLEGATGGAYHRETRLEVDSNDHLRSLARVWLWELGELSGITRKADVNALKNTLTQETTTFRVPYARYEVTKRTLTNFIGTVNPDGIGFLRDMTGNRRFACIDVTGIDWEYNQIDITQVHAQAYHLYKTGETWLLSPEEVAVRDANNAAHEMERLIDDVMDTLFVMTNNNDDLINPIDIATAVHRFGYKTDMTICAMDAATWLKRQGLKKMGKPKTWRGLRFRKANDPATDPNAYEIEL